MSGIRITIVIKNGLLYTLHIIISKQEGPPHTRNNDIISHYNIMLDETFHACFQVNGWVVTKKLRLKNH